MSAPARGARRTLVAAAAALALAAPLEGQYARNRPQLTIGVAELEMRAATDSMDPLVHYDLAVGYWFHKRFDEAERSLRRTVEIEPRFAPAYLALGLIPYARRPKLFKEEEKGKVPAEWQAAVEEANRHYERAFLIDPMVDLKIYGLLTPPGEKMFEGFAYFWAADYGSAYRWFDEIFKYYKTPKQRATLPSFIYWYHSLAAAHVGQHDVAMAGMQVLLDRSLEREKTDTLVRFSLLQSNHYRYLLATMKQNAGLLKEAAALYEEALAHDLGLYFAHVQLANIHESMRRTGPALLERQRALEALPDDPGLLFELGESQARARRFAAANETLGRAMALNPYNARIPYTLGQVRTAMGDYVGAREAFERFIAIAPSRFGGQVSEVRRLIAAQPQPTSP